MEIASTLFDKRINAENILTEITISDYLKIAKKIVDSNEFQRAKVSNSKTVYSLLKKDLLAGCIMPPWSSLLLEIKLKWKV